MPKSYFAPADFEPCVKLGQNLSAVVVRPKCYASSRHEGETRIYTCITCEWLWVVSLGEEIHCFPKLRHTFCFIAVIFQGCSSISYFTTFDCTSRALVSSPSSCLANAFELWQFLSWNFQCLKLGTGLIPITFIKSLWVVVICKNYEPGINMSSNSLLRRAIKYTQQILNTAWWLLGEHLTHNGWQTAEIKSFKNDQKVLIMVCCVSGDSGFYRSLVEKLQLYSKSWSNSLDCLGEHLKSHSPSFFS